MLEVAFSMIEGEHILVTGYLSICGPETGTEISYCTDSVGVDRLKTIRASVVQMVE